MKKIRFTLTEFNNNDNSIITWFDETSYQPSVGSGLVFNIIEWCDQNLMSRPGWNYIARLSVEEPGYRPLRYVFDRARRSFRESR